MDILLFRWVNGWPHPDWADSFVLLFDYFGREKLLIFLAAVALFSGLLSRDKRRLYLAALFMAVVLATYGSSTLIKYFIHRPRPYVALEGVYRVGYASGGFSFPSNHAALLAALAYFMQRVYKRGLLFWWTLAFLGGTARVYQGVHYPIDILGGWFVGSFISWGAISLFIMFFKKVEI